MLGPDGKLLCKELRIENCNLCNSACIICPREKMTRKTSVMSYDTFVRIVDSVVELGVTDCSIFGFGEPLIDRNIVEKVRYASYSGLTTYITTNGSLLDQQMGEDLIDAGLNHIRFSIHATCPINYMKVHKQLGWLTVWKNFGNFYCTSRGRDCKIHLSVIPMNDETVQEIRDTWEQYVDFLEIWRPHNWVTGRGYRLILPQRKTCGRPFGGPLQIQVDGTVIPCCFLINSELVLGNVLEEDIYDILTGSSYEALREAHRRGNLSGYPCESCDQLNGNTSNVLIYSSRDPSLSTGKLSTSKAQIREE